MPILMNYEGITGESQLQGKSGFLPVIAVNWGMMRTLQSVHPGSRGDADRVIQEVSVSRAMDSSSAALLREALTGLFDRTVEIHLLRTGPSNTLIPFAVYDLSNCGIASYSMAATDGSVIENMTLNFTKIMFTAFAVDDALNAIADGVMHDLVTNEGG